jgi:penicillin amidase
MSRPARSLAVLALASLAGCSEPSPTPDAGVDAPSTSDGGFEGDAGDPCEAEVTPPSCRPRFEGPTAAVEVIRDADGVPHLYGESSGDVFFASGYMQAHDRLVQMELMRRRALGTRAEVLGEGSVDDDTLMRILQIGHWGAVNASTLAREAPEQYVLLEAWAAGVNRYLAEIRSGEVPRPPGFGASELDLVPEDWTVDHALAVGKLLLFGNASQIEYDILTSILSQYFEELYADVPLFLPVRDAHTIPPEERPMALTSRARPEVPAHVGADGAQARRVRRELPPDAAERMRGFFARFADVPDFRSRGASNNWALDGRHTESGRPLVAGDPHQPLASPSLFWMHHEVAADGSLDVAGWSFVGGPAVQLGHNRHVAWTATTTYGDMMDLWDVRVVGGVARVGSVEVPLVRRTETIPVAGGEPVVVEVDEVPGYGVLLPDGLAPLPLGRPARRILFRWTGFGPTHELEGFLGFDRARSRDVFEAAVDRIELGLFNFVSADASGISYRVSPRIPDRGAPMESRRPYLVLDGDDPATYWDGTFLDAARLPHSRGGERGWIGSANNDPYGFLADGRIEGDPFYYGVFFDPGVRSARIEAELERLTARGAVTVADMQALQDDTYTIYADDFLPPLFTAWASRGTDPMLAAYRDRPELDALVTALEGWDRRMERDSREAVIFHAYVYYLTRHLLSDDFSALFDPILEAEPMYLLKLTSLCVRDAIAQSEVFWDGTRSQTTALALEETAHWLMARFGGTETSRYTWADFHGARFRSVYGPAFDDDWIPTDGADGTVNVASSRFFDGETPYERIDVGGGAVYRMVARFRDDGTPEAYFQMPRGVSGVPSDPFYENLHDDWVEHRYRRLRFERSEVEDGAAETFTIDP